MSNNAVDDIASRIMQITMEVLALEGKAPPLDSRIVDDLGADSIDLFSLVAALEYEFGGTIEEDEMDRFQTVSDVIEYIRSAQAEGVARPPVVER